MKTEIIIKGQIGGNFKLRNKLDVSNSELKKLPHNNFLITYPSKKEAVKALQNANQRFKSEDPEFTKSFGYQYLRGHSIAYDASQATIIENRY